jgi:hypothetical protein
MIQSAPGPKKEVKVDQIPKKREPSMVEILNRIVPPHKVPSKRVSLNDIDRVVEEAKILYILCFQPTGLYKGSYATHHAQIDDKHPLNFFVMADRRIIINPVITRHVNYFIDSKEACMTFSDKEQVIVPRWHKIEVEYTTVMLDPENKDEFRLSSPIQESLQGMAAIVFQHESDHGIPKYIYPV